MSKENRKRVSDDNEELTGRSNLQAFFGADEEIRKGFTDAVAPVPNCLAKKESTASQDLETPKRGMN